MASVRRPITPWQVKHYPFIGEQSAIVIDSTEPAAPGTRVTFHVDGVKVCLSQSLGPTRWGVCGRGGGRQGVASKPVPPSTLPLLAGSCTHKLLC